MAEKQLLQRLRALLPKSVTPILVTDAGFRAPWFRAVARFGWHYIGRLRHRTLIQPEAVIGSTIASFCRRPPPEPSASESVSHGRQRSLVCRSGSVPKAMCRSRATESSRDAQPQSHEHEGRRREREPWLLVVSCALSMLSARQIVEHLPQKHADRRELSGSEVRSLRLRVLLQSYAQARTHRDAAADPCARHLHCLAGGVGSRRRNRTQAVRRHSFIRPDHITRCCESDGKRYGERSGLHSAIICARPSVIHPIISSRNWNCRYDSWGNLRDRSISWVKGQIFTRRLSSDCHTRPGQRTGAK